MNEDTWIEVARISGPVLCCSECGGDITSEKGETTKNGNVETSITKITCTKCGKNWFSECIRYVIKE